MNKEKISGALPYIGIPVLAAAFWLFRCGDLYTVRLLAGEMLIVFGYIVSVSDIKEKTVPNITVLLMLGAWVALELFWLLLDTDTAFSALKDSLLGLLLGGGLFLLVYAISRKGLGGGDVKFVAVSGLYTGMAAIVTAALIGSVLAALFSLILLITKRIDKKGTIPLIPFLYIGMLVITFLQ